MKTRDYRPLLAELADAHTRRSPRSAAIQQEAVKYEIDGGSHALRLIEPFAPRIATARGAWLTDEDGHKLLDFWQGHLGNILGHNPEAITSVLARSFQEGAGLLTGFTDQLQTETAALLCQRTNSERVRFTTSGTLATMYAIQLSCAFTERCRVLKVGGGWHGAHPWALKGVSFHTNHDKGFKAVDSEGVPDAICGEVVTTVFNDTQQLEDDFRQHGDGLACFIVEPFLGAGGFMPASREYLRAARELTEQYGALLILDEVIAGFRFRAGDVAALYGVKPDLATYGKIMGGGMPVAAVAGRADVLALAGRAQGSRVKFSGGTFSSHPASMLAAKAMMMYLTENEAEVYPRLASLGKIARNEITTAFAREGIDCRCTGYDGDILADSSLFMMHFPYLKEAQLRRPEDWSDPSLCDSALRLKVVDSALLAEDVFVVHGHGGVSMAHTETDLQKFGQACGRIARRIKPYL